MGSATGSDMAKNGPPPVDAAAFYVGQVMHQRLRPIGHRFSYDVFSLLIDLDHLPEADAKSAFFSVNRNSLLSFHEKDHTDIAGRSLRAYVDDMLQRAGVADPADRILLVCYPRILGLVFNPLAVYYAYDASGNLIALVYEVRNTYGERHTYVCPIMEGDVTSAGVRQECDKIFHVSPFIPMTMRYHFRMLPPGDGIRWRILEHSPDGPLLAATFSGQQRPVTTGQILRLVARIPHLTIKIVLGIHWEALKLWIKGMRYIPRPAAPSPVSVWRHGKTARASDAPTSNGCAPAE